MTRKEMIVRMLSCYTTCFQDLNYSPVRAMDRVLEMQEELGMLPPDMDFDMPIDLQGKTKSMKINCWESEDE